MTTPAHADRTLFVTLPVADVARTMSFFQKLGFTFDPKFGDGQTTACMAVNGQTFIMFGTHAMWAEFSKLPAANPKTHALALYNFVVASRDEVDSMVDAAVAEGATDHEDAQNHGFMYSRSFFDLDGHGWQVMWMDPAAADMAPQERDKSMQEANV
jgi:predicted lactoylglutathione lyase